MKNLIGLLIGLSGFLALGLFAKFLGVIDSSPESLESVETIIFTLKCFAGIFVFCFLWAGLGEFVGPSDPGDNER